MTIETKIAKSYKEAMELVKKFHAMRPDCYFVYNTENCSDDYKTTNRFFDGRGEDGYSICFAMIEFVKGGKLETVRVINTYRQTAIDIKIEIEENADIEPTNTKPIIISFTEYNTMLLWGEKISNGQHEATCQLKAYIKKTFNAAIDEEELVESIGAGDLNSLRKILARFKFFVKDDAGYLHKFYIYENGEVVLAEMPTAEQKKINAENDTAKYKVEVTAETDGSEDDVDEEFTANVMSTDNDNTADKEFFHAHTAFVDATRQRNLAEIELNAAQDKFDAAKNAQLDAKQKLHNIADKTVKQLDNLIVNVFIPAKMTMTLITQDDNKHIKTDFSQFTITYYDGFHLANHHDYCATYDTPAEVRIIFTKLQAAIERGDKEFKFPTVDELNNPPKMPPCAPKSPDINAEDNLPANDEIPPKNAFDAQIALVNKTAPVGWHISFDTDQNNFPVKFHDKTITTLDSLALTKFLTPEQFFEQFKPLVDKNFSPQEQFRADRQEELAALQDIRKLIIDDAERLKSIDDMIDAIKRDLLKIALE